MKKSTTLILFYQIRWGSAMLTYDLECRDGLSRYDYLYRCVKEDILSGRLKPGEKLP